MSLKILSVEATLSTTASNVASGTIIRLVETGGTSSSLITVKDAANNVVGSATLLKGSELILRKARTETLQSNGAGTVLAASVVSSF